METKIQRKRRQDRIILMLRSRTAVDALSAPDILEGLQSIGFGVNAKTVRRDLLDLAGILGLEVTGKHPVKYYPSKDFKIKREIYLEDQSLQILLIALENLKETSHQYFKVYTGAVENAILGSLDAKTAKELLDIKKYYHFNYGVSGKPEKSEIEEFKKVMEAFRKRVIFTCKNISPYKDAAYNQKIRKFAPLKFILSTGIPYLMAEDQENKELKTLRLTRLTEVKLTDDKVVNDRLKDLGKMESMVGGFGGTSEKAVEMELIGDTIMGNYFKEKKIHKSQIVTDIKKGQFKITFKCAPSSELSRLFASFGGHLKSASPPQLKNEILTIWKEGISSLE